MGHNNFGIHEFLFMLGCVLMFLAAFPGYPVAPSPWDGWRLRLMAAGLFFWMLSTAI